MSSYDINVYGEVLIYVPDGMYTSKELKELLSMISEREKFQQRRSRELKHDMAKALTDKDK